MASSNDLQSIIALIPSSVKIAHVNEIIEKLRNHEVYSDEFNSKLSLLISFLTETPLPFEGNYSLITELLAASFDYLWLSRENDLNFCHLISSIISESINSIEDQTNVSLCLQKNLKLIIRKCSPEVIDSVIDIDIQVSLIVLDSIINALNKRNSLLLEVDNELITAIELLLDVSLRTLSILKTFLISFKKFLQLKNSNEFLRKYWNVIKIRYNEQRFKDNYLKCELFKLCFLADFYITSDVSVITYPLHYDTTLWEIIQAGLIDDTALIRKQSLYLLKRYVSALDDVPADFNTNLFSWNKLQSKEILEYWNSYFIIWEALEDKQIHLIVPALKKLDIIIEKSEKNLIHLDWMYCLFIFCFKSDSITIVKNSIMIFCDVKAHFLFSSNKYKNVLYYFFNALNNIALYNHSSLNCEDKFINCFGKWFQTLGTLDNGANLFNELISILSEVNLSSVPIFYIMKEIGLVSWKLELDSTSLNVLKKIMKDSSRGQNIKIRGAVQNLILSFVSRYPLYQNVLLEDLADFLIAFPSSESLKRGTKCWTTCSEWLQKYVVQEKVGKFLENNCNKFTNFKGQNNPYILSVEALARMIILFEDAHLLPEIKYFNIFNSVFSYFADCDKRLYINAEEQNLSFNFICKLLVESVPYNKDLNFNSKVVLKIIDEFDNLITFLCIKLKTVGDLEDIDTVDMYLLFIETILNNHKYLIKDTNKLLSLFKVATEVLEKETGSTLQNYFAFKVASLFYTAVKMLKEDYFSAKYFTGTSYSNKFLCESDSLFNNKEKIRKLESGKSRFIWSGIYHVLCSTRTELFLEKFPLQQLYELGINSFYIGEKENIIYVLKVFKLLMPSYMDKFPQYIEAIFKTTWNACFDLRKTDIFWKAFDKWIEMVYQECTFGDPNYHTILKSYCCEILELGNDIFGLINLLIERLYNLRCAIDFTQFADIIHSCLIFGPILRKDQRIEREVCDSIESMGDGMAINVLTPGLNVKSSSDVRIFALVILLDKDTFERTNLVKTVIRELLQSYKESCKSNRYFNDSLVHRKRNRILQTLLTLYSLIINDVYFINEVNSLLNFVNENLLSESQQPSIRYQLEWLYILLVYNNSDDSIIKKNIWNALTQASTERLGSVCSFIAIAYHLVKLKQDEGFFEEFLENVLPWCMSQNFNIRLYAQVTLKKLLPQFENIIVKYEILTRNQWKIYQQGNMLNNAQKLEADFYFDCFHPVKHFSLQTIFWDLPRLSNVSSEEWIPLTALKAKITNKPEKLLWGDEELENVCVLSERLVPNWILKAHGSNSENEEQYSIQKKFTPWKGMFPQELDADIYSRKKGELILVASLIDKTSNLGGLARTCEVFGAKELIIDSLNFINDKQFTSLSMTAEKHINIREVKSYHLTDYLSDMKKLGYSVVGAEQTTDSISLCNYKFNKKTVLILGSEREGIPVNILPFLDACIEIPQYGLIRSLNVHVTGAICLWEYAKQHYQDS